MFFDSYLLKSQFFSQTGSKEVYTGFNLDRYTYSYIFLVISENFYKLRELYRNQRILTQLAIRALIIHLVITYI